MPPAAKPKGMLSGFISDDEEDTQFMESAMPTPDSAAENRNAPAKKARGRPKGITNKASKTKPAKNATATNVARADKKREPLINKTSKASATDSEDGKANDKGDSLMEELISDDELDAGIEHKAKIGSKTKRAAPVKSSSDPPASPQRREAPKKKAGRPKKQAQVEPEPEPEEEEVEETMPFIPETQAAPMEIDEPEEEIEAAPPARKKEVTKSKYRSESQTAPTSRKRAGSASDHERSSPAVRRKLGSANNKIEKLQYQYDNLREIGIKQATENFEKLRSQSEAKTQAANELIAALKTEVKEARAAEKEVRSLHKNLDSKDAELVQLREQLETIGTSLRESQAENKNLSTKLAASRSAAASVESATAARVPGSAKKAGAVRMIGSAEAAQAASAAQLKEHLYGDLTGLVILGVKREADEDVYDCIQTGRNGTLHFKLAITDEKTAASYEDVQCSYIPQLNESRDKDLMDLLPEYLVDEIAFPRPQAGKFYSRVVKALYDRPE